MKKHLSFLDKVKLFPLWILTLLPLKVLYGISDFMFLIVYNIIRYRKATVLTNLSNAFPEKTQKEIHTISRKFYRYLCDSFIESIYLINMGPAECNQRYEFLNLNLLDNLARDRRNIILATSHYGNWEWANNLNNLTLYKILGIYKPLSNKLFDRLFKEIRGKYGSKPIPMKQTLRETVDSLNKDELFALYFVADQRPGQDDLSYWTSFFKQEAPVITGMEKISRRFNLAIVFMNVHRIRRGYYKIVLELIVDKPEDFAENMIAERYIRKVEELVKEQPELYLWSHNRWKYQKKDYLKE